MNHRRLTLIVFLVLFVILGGCTVSRPGPTPGDGDDTCAASEESCNRIEGFSGNTAAAGVVAATISGGGRVGFPHRVLADMGSIGGGAGSQAGEMATVGGGLSNVAGGIRSTIGGGARNTASRDSTTIAGGFGNVASGAHATVGGGNVNAALEVNATVGGGAGNIAAERHSTIGGGTSNIAQGFIATIAGGLGNHASGAYATIGGGLENVAGGLEATVGGGGGNMAGAADAAIGGGLNNRVTDEYSTVSGGRSNVAGNGDTDPTDAVYATVGGGADNVAGGPFSVIPGGLANTAAAPYSFAAGRRANIGAAHAGAFLYADSNDFAFGSATANEFAARATGGVRFVTAIDAAGGPSAGVRLAQGGGSWEFLSDRNAKTGFAPVVGRDILERIARLSITTWSYRTQPSSIRHIGPTAQDFYTAFGLGTDDGYIGSADADGVALAAIQGLYQVVQDKDAQIKAQQQRIASMQAELAAQRDQLASLEARLSAVEKTVGTRGIRETSSASLPGGWPTLGGLFLFGLIVAIVILAFIAACSTSAPNIERGKPTAAASLATSTGSPTLAAQGMPTPTDVWSALLQRTPFPYGTPLPPPTRTILDGDYAKLDPKEGTPVPCRRCPDYAPEGGIWKLHLDNGVFRIYHQVTGWRSIASFTISQDRLYLFNDPVCTDAVGAYKWKLEKGTLTLEVIEDECAIRLRAMNLTGLPWLSCRPPNAEAAVTDHWWKPPGCQ